MRNLIRKQGRTADSGSGGGSGTPGGSQSVPPTTINGPGKNPHLIEGTKYFVFNETGNIMVSSTQITSSSIEQNVRDVFNEVTVFFAAMTKAMTNTVMPGITPAQNYTIYDYTALNNIIGGSGLFVNVTQEQINYTSTSVGVDFSTDLVEALLGLPSGAGELSFATGLIASLGNRGLQLNAMASSSNSQVANIVFCCEYLLGMPIISAIVVSIDASDVAETVTFGPCISESSQSTTLALTKEVYLFVTPTFIKEYAPDLDSVIDSAAYNEFVSYLESLLLGTAMITSITDNTGKVASTTLSPTSSYLINGTGFGPAGTVSLGTPASGNLLQVVAWTPNQITIQGMASGSTAPGAPANIVITAPSATSPLGTSVEQYSMGT